MSLDRFVVTQKRDRSQLSPPDVDTPKRIPVEASQTTGGMDRPNKALMEAIGGMMDQKLANVTRVDDLKAIEEKLDTITKENTYLKNEVNKIKYENKTLRDKLEELDNFNKRTNLIFRGLKDTDENDCDKTIKEFCTKVLGIQRDISIERAYMLGKNKGSRYRGEQKMDMILTEFSSFAVTQEVLRNSYKLKGTGISVVQDFTLDWRRKRSKLLGVRREILKSNKDHRIYVRQDWLSVGGKRMRWNEEKGLQAEGGEEDGALIIKKILGCDISLFVQQLRQQDQPDRS